MDEKMKSLLDQARREVHQEILDETKEDIKKRLREVREAKLILNRLEKHMEQKLADDPFDGVEP